MAITSLGDMLKLCEASFFLRGLANPQTLGGKEPIKFLLEIIAPYKDFY
jgi:hypothetical protein